MEEQVSAARAYFEAQNASDADRVVRLFSDDAEVLNVNMAPVHGTEGVKNFCENLYARTSVRHFEILEIFEKRDAVVMEWRVKMTFRAGAKVGPWQLAEGFDAELRGVNKFEFLPTSSTIRRLRIYHETSTVMQLAQAHAVKN